MSDSKKSPMAEVLGEPKKAETKEVSVSAPEKLPTNKYLTIVPYVGGQVDTSITSTAVLNPDQFIYGYENEESGFLFKEFTRELGTDFSLEKIAKVFRVDADEDTVLDCIYNLGDNGFADAEGNSDEFRFLRKLTGQEVDAGNKADPRAFA